MNKKEIKLEELKTRALNLVLSIGKDSKDYDAPEAKIFREFMDLNSNYDHGDCVWCIEEDEVCQANIIGVSVNNAGYAFYRLSEPTGRTMFGGEWMPEKMLFPTREAMVEHYKKVLGLEPRVVVSEEEFKQRNENLTRL